MQATVPCGAKRDLMKGRGWNMLSKEWMRTCSRRRTAMSIRCNNNRLISNKRGEKGWTFRGTSLPFGVGGWYRLLGRYPVKMLSSLGITHHVSPTSILFFGGRKTLNCPAENDKEGTAGPFQDRSPLRELWDT